MACNIGPINDISLHVYHLDYHEVLFHNLVFVFNISIMSWLYFSDIIVASSSIDTLNVIYHIHTLILLVCLPQRYVIITMLIVSRIIRRTRLSPSFILILCVFIRCNFISYHERNGWESSNQLWQHISHIKPCVSCFIIWGRSPLY